MIPVNYHQILSMRLRIKLELYCVVWGIILWAKQRNGKILHGIRKDYGPSRVFNRERL